MSDHQGGASHRGAPGAPECDAHGHGHDHGHESDEGRGRGPRLGQEHGHERGHERGRGHGETSRVDGHGHHAGSWDDTPAEARAAPSRGWHLHFDCASGVAGDMTLGALIHLGVPEEVVTGALAALGVPGLAIRCCRVHRGGIAACHVVGPTEGPEEPCRTWRDIQVILHKGALAPEVRDLALRVFERLARAEALVHGTSLAEVHFHEVGGLDAICDIVGTCAAIAFLAPASVSASAIPLGEGTVMTRHGLLPLPAPATVELLSGVLTVPGSPGAGELTTPTGAALVTTLAERYGAPPPLRLQRQGFGAGSREIPGQSNVLRLLAGEPVLGNESASDGEEALGAPEASQWVEGYANIDDMNPELGPWILERLLAAGARDAWLEPIVMKKGRAAVKVGFLGLRKDTPALAACLLKESTTLGVRFFTVERRELPRHQVKVQTPWGEVRVKLGGDPRRPDNVAPEHEDCRRLAVESGQALKAVYQAAVIAFFENRSSGS